MRFDEVLHEFPENAANISLAPFEVPENYREWDLWKNKGHYMQKQRWQPFRSESYAEITVKSTEIV